MTDYLPADVLTNDTLWASYGNGYTYPAPLPTYVAPDMIFSLVGMDEETTENWTGTAFYGVDASTPVTIGEVYRITMVLVAAAGPMKWRAAVLNSDASGWQQATGSIRTVTFDWTATETNPVFGIEVGPTTAGEWDATPAFVLTDFTVQESPTATGDEPTVTCRPNWDFPIGVGWVEGDNIVGSQIVSITRVNVVDGTRTEINFNPVDLTSGLTYNDVRDNDAEGNYAAPQEYNDWWDPTSQFGAYGAYSDMLYTISGHFAVIDTTVPLGQDYYYEIEVKQFYGQPNLTITSGHCRFPYEDLVPGTAEVSGVPGGIGMCVPVLFTDPLVPRVSQWLSLLSIDALSYPARAELQDVIGRRGPVSVSNVRSLARTSFTLMTRTLRERADLLSILATGRVLLYRNPDPDYPENNWYVAISDVQEQRISPDHGSPVRKWNLEVAVVDRPFGYIDITMSRTYETLLNYEPNGTTAVDLNTYTYDAVDDAYRDYIDVLIGRKTQNPGYESTVIPQYVYGQGVYPTASAAATSWNLTP